MPSLGREGTLVQDNLRFLTFRYEGKCDQRLLIAGVRLLPDERVGEQGRRVDLAELAPKEKRSPSGGCIVIR